MCKLAALRQPVTYLGVHDIRDSGGAPSPGSAPAAPQSLATWGLSPLTQPAPRACPPSADARPGHPGTGRGRVSLSAPRLLSERNAHALPISPIRSRINVTCSRCARELMHPRHVSASHVPITAADHRRRPPPSSAAPRRSPPSRAPSEAASAPPPSRATRRFCKAHPLPYCSRARHTDRVPATPSPICPATA